MLNTQGVKFSEKLELLPQIENLQRVELDRENFMKQYQTSYTRLDKAPGK